ncbi:MAG TPA: DUF721 domain-containing protein [Bacteroidia bacterium]|nr:DUF721 domain-containing protein [Bacteroidia bacterium]
MSRHNEQSLKDAIQQMLEAYKLRGRMDELKLISSWEKVMGPAVHKRTLDLSIRQQILYVRLESSALREELSYGREMLIQRLNEEAGTEVIKQVVFI